MLTLAFVLAVIAAVLFGVEAYRTKSWIAAGLVVLTVAWIVTQTVTSGGHVTF